jgi:sugar phosphate isomerase/epimerase
MSFKTSVCHFSFHRLWKDESWDCDRLCREVAAAGSEGIDFHQRLTGDPATARERITKALETSGLALSGISLSNNYNTSDAGQLAEQLAASKEWIDIAADLRAPVCRVFGGGRKKDEEVAVQLSRTCDALKEVAAHAEAKGVVMALENHGGFPSSGEEQAEMIETVGSKALGATIDVGNYLSGGQEGIDGTKAAARHSRYVHFKDCMKLPTGETPWGWKPKSCTVGVGAVDHEACLRVLKEAGYSGWVALEYEGPSPERIGVEESLYFMKKVIARVQ